MSEPWVILSERYGGDTRDPSDEKLANAVRELFIEDLPGMTEGDYEEHGAGFVRFGYDEGPMYVVEITRLEEATLEQWGDQDYEQELAPPVTLEVTQEQALEFWKLLARGEVDQLKAMFGT